MVTEKVKWAMKGTSEPHKVADLVHNVFGIKDVDIFESSIIDSRTGNKVEDIWVLEFMINAVQKEVLKRAFNLEEIRGYLM